MGGDGYRIWVGYGTMKKKRREVVLYGGVGERSVRREGTGGWVENSLVKKARTPPY